MNVKQLGYLVFDVDATSHDGMRTVLGELFEATVVTAPDGSDRVRLDGRDFRIRLRPAAQNRLAAIGWEVESVEELDRLAARLAAAGHVASRMTAADCADRQVAAALQLADPEGFPLELYVDQPFERDEQMAARFVCGSGEDGAFGLGHLVQICNDRAETQRFYMDMLGFALSDRITWPAADLWFLHCNRRHHSLALSNEALGLKAGMIDHFMIEARSRKQVDRAYARLSGLGFAVSQTLGQHTNDLVYSFYMMGPMGFRIEFGFGGRTVDDPAAWQVVQYDAPSSWGHELLQAG